MRLLIILASLMAAIAAKAETYQHGSKDITKLEAIKTLLREPNATVLRCSPVMLTEKATLKNRPKVRQ